METCEQYFGKVSASLRKRLPKPVTYYCQHSRAIAAFKRFPRRTLTRSLISKISLTVLSRNRCFQNFPRQCVSHAVAAFKRFPHLTLTRSLIAKTSLTVLSRGRWLQKLPSPYSRAVAALKNFPRQCVSHAVAAFKRFPRCTLTLSLLSTALPAALSRPLLSKTFLISLSRGHCFQKLSSSHSRAVAAFKSSARRTLARSLLLKTFLISLSRGLCFQKLCSPHSSAVTAFKNFPHLLGKRSPSGYTRTSWTRPWHFLFPGKTDPLVHGGQGFMD